MRTKKLTQEQCELFAKVFPVMSNTEVATLLNVGLTTVKNYADIMGLTKDPAYISKVRKAVSKKGHYTRWNLLRTKQSGYEVSKEEKQK